MTRAEGRAFNSFAEINLGAVTRVHGKTNAANRLRRYSRWSFESLFWIELIRILFMCGDGFARRRFYDNQHWRTVCVITLGKLFVYIRVGREDERNTSATMLFSATNSQGYTRGHLAARNCRIFRCIIRRLYNFEMNKFMSVESICRCIKRKRNDENRLRSPHSAVGRLSARLSSLLYITTYLFIFMNLRLTRTRYINTYRISKYRKFWFVKCVR